MTTPTTPRGNLKANRPKPKPITKEERAHAGEVMKIIYDLARQSLYAHARYRQQGLSIEDIPYEAEVRAVLGVEQASREPVTLVLPDKPKLTLVQATSNAVKNLLR